MTQDTIEREITIEAPVERVWSLITEPEHIAGWFGDGGAEVDLQPGGAMALTWSKHGTVLCEVVAVEAPRRFAYRWVPGGINVPITQENSTVVEFTLAPQGDGTLLRVVESGFAALTGDREKTRAGNVEGWQAELGDLVEYAASVAV